MGDQSRKGLARLYPLVVATAVILVVGYPVFITVMGDPLKSPPVATSQTKVAPLAESDLPFGLSSATKLADLSLDPTVSKPNEGIYVLSSVPQPAAPFERYSVTYFDGIGLCAIRAMDAGHKRDALGSDTTATMSRIATALAVKYGKPDKLHDYCSGDVICEGRFWDYALNNGSRTHAYQWQNPKAKTVRAIALEALGSDLGPYIRLTYELGNAKACEAREAQMGAQNL